MYECNTQNFGDGFFGDFGFPPTRSLIKKHWVSSFKPDVICLLQKLEAFKFTNPVNFKTKQFVFSPLGPNLSAYTL